MGELVREQSGGAESLTMMLVSEVSNQEGVDPVSLTPPIHSTVDMDALEKLLLGDTPEPIGVEFEYSGHQIAIEKAEELRIEVE